MIGVPPVPRSVNTIWVNVCVANTEFSTKLCSSTAYVPFAPVLTLPVPAASWTPLTMKAFCVVVPLTELA